MSYPIDQDWEVINNFCHRCCKDSLRPVRWGKKGGTVEMRCSTPRCAGREWRKVFKRRR